MWPFNFLLFLSKFPPLSFTKVQPWGSKVLVLRFSWFAVGHLLDWQVEGGARLHLVLFFLLSGVSRRTHPRPFLVVPFNPVLLPFFFPPHPLLLTLPLSLPLPFSLSTFPLAVVSLPLSVALPKFPLAFALLGKKETRRKMSTDQSFEVVLQNISLLSNLYKTDRKRLSSFLGTIVWIIFLFNHSR